MLPLGDRSVHVWRIDVRQPAGVLRDLRSSLSRDEEERAARYRFDRERDSFVCTRAALRSLAGAYLDLAPRAVAFTYDAKGKPGLGGLSFNVSHSGDVGLAAFAPSAPVGVDVEEMRRERDLRGLAQRFFAPGENAALQALDGDALVTGFYRCWTRKEAFVKAVGEGVSYELARFEVSVGADARIVSVDGDEGAAGDWWMADVPMGPRYAGAVVAGARVDELVVRDWAPVGAAAV
ncbi:MAG TPA: 4'-phosphopantetheinyl transferase superfamily protein [Actinomycetota bacterium]|nr:4'-phosphopantetheinyl transferase superfamily protein [Actinomycetota bacterium]